MEHSRATSGIELGLCLQVAIYKVEARLKASHELMTNALALLHQKSNALSGHNSRVTRNFIVTSTAF